MPWYNIKYRNGETELECSVSGTLTETTDDLDFRARSSGVVSEVVAQTGMSVVQGSKREVTASENVITRYAK